MKCDCFSVKYSSSRIISSIKGLKFDFILILTEFSKSFLYIFLPDDNLESRSGPQNNPGESFVKMQQQQQNGGRKRRNSSGSNGSSILMDAEETDRLTNNRRRRVTNNNDADDESKAGNNGVPSGLRLPALRSSFEVEDRDNLSSPLFRASPPFSTSSISPPQQRPSLPQQQGLGFLSNQTPLSQSLLMPMVTSSSPSLLTTPSSTANNPLLANSQPQQPAPIPGAALASIQAALAALQAGQMSLQQVRTTSIKIKSEG